MWNFITKPIILVVCLPPQTCHFQDWMFWLHSVDARGKYNCTCQKLEDLFQKMTMDRKTWQKHVYLSTSSKLQQRFWVLHSKRGLNSYCWCTAVRSCFCLGNRAHHTAFPIGVTLVERPLEGKTWKKHAWPVARKEIFCISRKNTTWSNGEENLYAMKNQISIEKMNKIQVQSAITDV